MRGLVTSARRALRETGTASRGTLPAAAAMLLALLQLPPGTRPWWDQGRPDRGRFDRSRRDEAHPERRAQGTRREFHFTRAVYTAYRRYNWATDYPKADRQFLIGVHRLLSHLDLSEDENPIRLDDPELNRFPFLYAVEVGRMALTDPEVEGLRRYLQAGGFLVVDDFWGSQEWENFENEIQRVLPGAKIVDLPRDHPVFSAFYDIKEFLQVPNVGNAMVGVTSERDGYVAYYRGIFDDKGHLVVAIAANTDLGDAWEWAEVPEYPLKYSTFAYQMGVNLIVYAMSH